MNHPHDLIDVPPVWLSSALIAINRLPENSPRDVDQNRMARAFVRSIESDIAATPRIWRDVLGVVRLLFTNDVRTVEVYIRDGRSFRAVRYAPHATPINRNVSRNFIDEARALLHWIWPVEGMTEAYANAITEIRR